MPIGISITKMQHRFDSPSLPYITVSGSTGFNRILIPGVYSYYQGNEVLPWTPPNRSYENLVIKALELNGVTYVPATGTTFDSGSAAITRTGADGFSGAVAGPWSTDIAIEGKPTNILVTTGISLQSGTIDYDFIFSNGIEHCIIFGVSNALSIWEHGVYKGGCFWALGDRGLIIREGDIVKYYVIRANGTVELLRSTRSNLAASVYAVPMVYHNGATVENCFVYVGTKAETTITTYGVLDGTFQDWGNQQQFESLAEKTMTKDKVEDFTYLSPVENVISMGLNLEWREEEKYQEFREFFEHHDLKRPFIFKDAARNKLRRIPRFPMADNEMLVNFVSAWKDNPLGAGIYGASVDIRECVHYPVIGYGA